MNEPRQVLKREVYRPQLEDGTKLKPIEGFTEGKIYSIFEEKTDCGPSVSVFGRQHFCGIYYLVRDDKGEMRHVDSHYFWHKPKLIEQSVAETVTSRMPTHNSLKDCKLMTDYEILTEWVGMSPQEAKSRLAKAKKEVGYKVDELKRQILEQNPQLLSEKGVANLRDTHEKMRQKGQLGWGGIDFEESQETTLWQKVEKDANPGDVDLRVLSGLKRLPNSFDKMDQLLEGLKKHSSIVEGQIKELEFELRLLKKLAANR